MNEDNKIFKTNEFSIEISPVGKAIQAKDIQYFSYDENSGLQLIHILMDGKPLDLPSGTEIRLSAVKLNNQSQKLIYTPEIVDPLKGIVSFVIPREFLGYQGQIRCGLYINFSNNQTMHVGYFYINMGVSDIDTNLTVFTEDFWQGWSEFEAGSTAKMQELEQQIGEYLSQIGQIEGKVQLVENTLSEIELRIGNAQQAIDAIEAGYAPKLGEVKQAIDDVPFLSGVFSKVDSTSKEVDFPTEFSWKDAPIKIFKSDLGEIRTDFDASNFKPDITGLKTYYVSLSGSNSNDGLSENTPFRRVSDALQKTDCGQIIVSGGIYPRGQAWGGFSPVRNMIIKAKSGEKVVFSASDELSWTKVEGSNNVYQASRTTVNDVFDARFVNRFDDYAELKNVNSIDECEETQASWYSDGTIVYVHTFDSRPADSYIRAYLNTNNGLITVGNHFYVEGIEFEGGNSAFRLDPSVESSDMLAIFKNCKFKYCKLLNAFSAYGSTVYLQNCEASYGNQDGFNYHIRSGIPCKVIEVNCRSHRNGRDGANQNNGSTNHDGGKTIRVNGQYFENHGPNVIDVNEGSESWNIGVSAFNSTADSGISNSDFKNSNVGAAKMWLDSCLSYGSEYSIVTAGNGSITYVTNTYRNAPLSNETNTETAGYETLYVPVSEYHDILAQ